ncbi:hypothetical protein Sango_1730300 [Sesamum angolense]|uniref:Reverse transcriptase domain-containing protein n=1 Tax=Sesamum angolense TaxID=2727404 RepID=A0AAE1WM07_9LAMI|nr:hypothetical protein Sango_1730300 [Sesamum angolense]
MTLKLDFSKAYDKVERSFLHRVLERGLHQGDPLSPYFSLLCIEMPLAIAIGGTIREIGISRDAPKVSHVLFADDTFIVVMQRAKQSMPLMWCGELMRQPQGNR